MPDPRHLQVIYLLHLPIERTFTLGPYVLWPYYAERAERIGDKGARAHLDQLFGQMLDYRGKPLREIAILSVGSDVQLAPVSSETLASMRTFMYAFLLSAVIKNDGLGDSVASENFQTVVQNFRPGWAEWATQDGSYIHMTVGGLKLRDAGLRLPGYVPRPRRIKYDEKLLAGLVASLVAPRTPLADRIARALPWLSHAYVNVDGFAYQNRILLLMIAFEMLADQVNLNGDGFGHWLDANWGIPVASKRSSSATWAEGKGPHGEVGWWGVEFYRMRNAIIHGDHEGLDAHDSQGREYFGLGVSVFAECVKELLRCDGKFPAGIFLDGIFRAWLLDKKETVDDGR